MNKKTILLLLAIILGLSIRLYLVPKAYFGTDGHTIRKWTYAVTYFGVSNIYTTSRYDLGLLGNHYNQPPLYAYLLYVIGRIYTTFRPDGTWIIDDFMIFLFKMPPILADVLASILIFVVVRRMTSFKIAYLAMLFYLFNPGVIYVSAYWGGIDAIPALFMLLSIMMLDYGKPLLSWFFMSLGVLVKLQSLVILPIIFVVAWRIYGLRQLIVGVGICIVTSLILLSPFIYNGNTSDMTTSLSYEITSLKGISMGAFNFWWLISMALVRAGYTFDGGQTDIIFSNEVLDSNLYLPIRAMNLLVLGIYTLFVLYFLIKNYSSKMLYFSSFLMAFGFFMLTLGVHERYLVYSIPFVTLICFLDKKFITLYVSLTAMFFLNLIVIFHPFWNEVFTRGHMSIISVINTFAFLYAISLLNQTFNKKDAFFIQKRS